MSADSVAKQATSVAMVGKGGVGKTALTVLLTKVLVGHRERLLVVDADPVVGLPQALGVQVAKTIGDVSEDIIRAARTGGRKAKVEVVSMLDYMVLEALVESDGFALIAMGKREGEGCFCPVNDILRDALRSLSQSFDVILVDGEAGVEQVNRRVTDKVDILLTVTDPTIRGVKTAALIDSVADKRRGKGVARTGLVITRVREGQEEQLRQAAAEAGLDIVGLIPEDKSITECDLAGTPLFDLAETAPSLVAVREMATKLGLLA